MSPSADEAIQRRSSEPSEGVMNRENHLLPFRTSFRLSAPMSPIKRTTTLLLVCALALAVGVPAAAVAQDEPAGDQYVLEVPEGGNGEAAADGSGRFVGLDVKAMRTQKAEVASKHLSNSRKIFLNLVEKVRTFDRNAEQQMIAARDYEGWKWRSSTISWA